MSHKIAISNDFKEYWVEDNGCNSAVIANTEPVIYVVAVCYDTGDSFNRYPNQTCYLDAFSSLDRAEAFANIIADDSEKEYQYKGGNSVTYTDDLGNQRTCGTGTWKGYFEHFNSVDIIACHKRSKSTSGKNIRYL